MIETLAWVTALSAHGHDVDEPEGVAALAAAGVRVDVAAWDDPGVDWSGYDRVVLRSTWDYQHRLPGFLAWLGAVDVRSDLRNPLPMVRWSLDKHYLADLAAAGIPVVPTVFVEPGDELRVPAGPFVVKPTIGASSQGVRVHDGDRDGATGGAAAHVARLHATGAAAMVQPLVRSASSDGEYPLVYLAGEFSHAVVRHVTQGPDGAGRAEWSDPHRPTAAQHAVARAVMDDVTRRFGTPTYARIDLLTDDDGAPTVLEVELVEPSLFLPEAGADALPRLVHALTS